MAANRMTSLDNVDYPGGFYRELSPADLNFICAINGVEGPDLGGEFTYCELGCGTGETTACLAGSHPQSRFYGIDLSPSHIEQAEALAGAGEISNATFVQADIATVDPAALPDFDYITMHGLYAWVPAGVQAAIRHFCARKLKPGGVVYLSYNTLPGWGSVAAMQRFFVDRAAQLPGTPLDQVQAIVDELEELRAQGAPYFRDHPVAANVLDRLRNADPRYIAHEYLGPFWQPLYFTEVFDAMVTAGLEYVGEGDVINNLLEHSVAPAFAERLGGISQVRERELYRDFIQNRFFRRDIYSKPDPARPRAGGDRPLRRMLFTLIADPAQIPDVVDVVGAPSIKLSGPWLARLKQLLGYRVLTLDEILADDQLRNCDPAQLIEGITLLAAGGFCVPCLRRETEPPRTPAERIRVVPRLNRVRLERHAWSEAGFTLVSPVTGSALTLNPLETALLLGLQHSDPLDWLAPQLEARGMQLQSSSDDKAVTGEAAARDALDAAMRQFLRYKLPKLAYLGLVEPA